MRFAARLVSALPLKVKWEDKKRKKKTKRAEHQKCSSVIEEVEHEASKSKRLESQSGTCCCDVKTQSFGQHSTGRRQAPAGNSTKQSGKSGKSGTSGTNSSTSTTAQVHHVGTSSAGAGAGGDEEREKNHQHKKKLPDDALEVNEENEVPNKQRVMRRTETAVMRETELILRPKRNENPCSVHTESKERHRWSSAQDYTSKKLMCEFGKRKDQVRRSNSFNHLLTLAENRCRKPEEFIVTGPLNNIDGILPRIQQGYISPCQSDADEEESVNEERAFSGDFLDLEYKILEDSNSDTSLEEKIFDTNPPHEWILEEGLQDHDIEQQEEEEENESNSNVAQNCLAGARKKTPTIPGILQGGGLNEKKSKVDREESANEEEDAYKVGEKLDYAGSLPRVSSVQKPNSGIREQGQTKASLMHPSQFSKALQNPEPNDQNSNGTLAENSSGHRNDIQTGTLKSEDGYDWFLNVPRANSRSMSNGSYGSDVDIYGAGSHNCEPEVKIRNLMEDREAPGISTLQNQENLPHETIRSSLIEDAVGSSNSMNESSSIRGRTPQISETSAAVEGELDMIAFSRSENQQNDPSLRQYQRKKVPKIGNDQSRSPKINSSALSSSVYSAKGIKRKRKSNMPGVSRVRIDPILSERGHHSSGVPYGERGERKRMESNSNVKQNCPAGARKKTPTIPGILQGGGLNKKKSKEKEKINTPTLDGGDLDAMMIAESCASEYHDGDQDNPGSYEAADIQIRVDSEESANNEDNANEEDEKLDYAASLPRDSSVQKPTNIQTGTHKSVDEYGRFMDVPRANSRSMSTGSYGSDIDIYGPGTNCEPEDPTCKTSAKQVFDSNSPKASESGNDHSVIQDTQSSENITDEFEGHHLAIVVPHELPVAPALLEDVDDLHDSAAEAGPFSVACTSDLVNGDTDHPPVNSVDVANCPIELRNGRDQVWQRVNERYGIPLPLYDPGRHLRVERNEYFNEEYLVEEYPAGFDPERQQLRAFYDFGEEGNRAFNDRFD